MSLGITTCCGVSKLSTAHASHNKQPRLIDTRPQIFPLKCLLPLHLLSSRSWTNRNRNYRFTMSTYTAVVLAKRPKGAIIPHETFAIKQNPVPRESELKEGEVIFQSLYLSLDPAMRGWLNGKIR